ncbi:DNA polymerase III subunit delta' [Thioflexithrix psekupsensis]|uniref:DNA polymerase III subunit delta' n=1 Tax=Thioflexithrix psekupsensis TaxID=1570016 RepID=A0A251X617_9GAMM|nr:DNA polymerase III subunit delta' [Thioflexithrix psekupsensis]OUD13185.1 DNA polymerase III subunit delta' [Thioflexithrix psekupsensis]
MKPAAILPWLQPHWQTLMTAHQQKRLPHALLLGGQRGLGKTQLAEQLVYALLCQDVRPDGSVCGHCRGCHLLSAGHHPDFIRLNPLENSQNILIDQVRGLIQFCTLTSHYGGYQIALIEPAEAMNQNAANGLLKLLEEPPDNTLLILVSHRPMQLLATIRSRCQRFDLGRVNQTEINTWLQAQLEPEQDIDLLLKLTLNAPLAALVLAQGEDMKIRRAVFNDIDGLIQGKIDPVKTAQQWSQYNINYLLYWLITWLMDVIRFSSTAQKQWLVNHDQLSRIEFFSQQLDLKKSFELLELLGEHYRLFNSTANIKPQSLLEVVTMTFVETTLPLRK